MRSLPIVLVTAALAATGGWFAARTLPAHNQATATATGERKIKFYQSPMHPWITSDKPGKCTICGMTLSPVYEGDTGFGSDGDLITLPAATASVIGIETSETVQAPLTRTLRVTGTLDDDETRHRILSAQTPGRIEKLYIDQVGARVKAGQPLATLYSPDVYAAQRIYIERYVAGPDAVTKSELSAALERLLELGLVEADVRRIEKTRQPESTVDIRAPFDGVVISRDAYTGAYVKDTDTLFEIGDFSHLWFIFDAYEPDLAFLQIGQQVSVNVPSAPGRSFTAPIAFIDPNLDPMTRTARVRVVIDNPDGQLRHRQTATGRVRIDTSDTIKIPRSALILTSDQPLVYIDKSGNTYEPRAVQPGRVGDNDVEILSGLKPGERVVTQGALLIDSQAQIAGPRPPTTRPTQDLTSAPPALSSDVPALHESLIFGTADAAKALATDDLAAYAQLLPTLTASVHQSGVAHDTLMPLAKKLVAGPDLSAARAAFEPFSTAVADFVRKQPSDRRNNVHVFQCPMSPVLGTARWLSRTEELKNPFFGSEMLECGEELK